MAEIVSCISSLLYIKIYIIARNQATIAFFVFQNSRTEFHIDLKEM